MADGSAEIETPTVPAEAIPHRRRCPPNPARTEARAILDLVRRGEIDASQARELIAIPPPIEATLRAFALKYPGLGLAVVRVIEFRAAVLAEFERQIQPL